MRKRHRQAITVIPSAGASGRPTRLVWMNPVKLPDEWRCTRKDCETQDVFFGLYPYQSTSLLETSDVEKYMQGTRKEGKED